MPNAPGNIAALLSEFLIHTAEDLLESFHYRNVLRLRVEPSTMAREIGKQSTEVAWASGEIGNDGDMLHLISGPNADKLERAGVLQRSRWDIEFTRHFSFPLPNAIAQARASSHVACSNLFGSPSPK